MSLGGIVDGGTFFFLEAKGCRSEKTVARTLTLRTSVVGGNPRARSAVAGVDRATWSTFFFSSGVVPRHPGPPFVAVGVGIVLSNLGWTTVTPTRPHNSRTRPTASRRRMAEGRKKKDECESLGWFVALVGTLCRGAFPSAPAVKGSTPPSRLPTSRTRARTSPLLVPFVSHTATVCPPCSCLTFGPFFFKKTVGTRTRQTHSQSKKK